MKIEILETEKAQEVKYPCLMEATAENEYNLVLFEKKFCGTVIKSSKHDVGSYFNDWYMPVFTPFKGTIKLSND